MSVRTIWVGCLASVLAACESISPADQATRDRLVGTWKTTDGNDAQVTYADDGTWQGYVTVNDKQTGESKTFRSHGTWKVKNGAIHNTMQHSDIPLGENLPMTSVEKLVDVGDGTYRYVCPFRGCTNTMQRVN